MGAIEAVIQKKDQLFVQVSRLCMRAGLKTVGHVALDGSKVQANASRHKR